MDFQRTGRTLRSLEHRQQLTIEDVMGLITDVLADAQSVSGGSADRLEIGDIRGTLTAMSATGRMLLQINKTKAQELGTAQDRKKRFDKLSGELESICSSCSSERADLASGMLLSPSAVER